MLNNQEEELLDDAQADTIFRDVTLLAFLVLFPLSFYFYHG